ncbi:MAG: hypothetical protein PVG71_12140 [Anaerolineae bacterium]
MQLVLNQSADFEPFSVIIQEGFDRGETTAGQIRLDLSVDGVPAIGGCSRPSDRLVGDTTHSRDRDDACLWLALSL